MAKTSPKNRGRNARRKNREPLAEDLRRAADLKAAREILSTRIGGYSGIVLPGGKKIK